MLSMEAGCDWNEKGEASLSNAPSEPSLNLLNLSSNDPFRLNSADAFFGNGSSVVLDRHEDFVGKLFESMKNKKGAQQAEKKFFGMSNFSETKENIHTRHEMQKTEKTSLKKKKVQGISFASRNLAKITKRRSMNCKATILKTGTISGQVDQLSFKSTSKSNKSALDAAQTQNPRIRNELGIAAKRNF